MIDYVMIIVVTNVIIIDSVIIIDNVIIVTNAIIIDNVVIVTNVIIIDNVITVTNVLIVCYCPTLSEVTWLTGNGIVEAAPGEMDLLGRTRALHREQRTE